MVDDKPVVDQVHDLQPTVNLFKDLKVEISELLQVGVITSKLSSCWNDYKKKLVAYYLEFVLRANFKTFAN